MLAAAGVAAGAGGPPLARGCAYLSWHRDSYEILAVRAGTVPLVRDRVCLRLVDGLEWVRDGARLSLANIVLRLLLLRLHVLIFEHLKLFLRREGICFLLTLEDSCLILVQS